MAEFDDRPYPIALPPQRVRSSGVPTASNLAWHEQTAIDNYPQQNSAVNVEQDGSQAVLLIDPSDIEIVESNFDLTCPPAIPSLVNRLVEKAQCPHPIWHPIQFMGWALSMGFGIVTLILALAVVAAIPIVNFIALGYLIEVEGRVARTGRFRDAFPLLPLAPRVGGMVLGIWIWLIPLRLLSWAAADARLIAPGSPADLGWHFALRIAMVLITIHICLALGRGGRLSCFFRPFKNLFWLRRQWKAGGYWTQAEQAVWDFVNQFRRSYYFWQGFKAWAGAMLWLVIPTALLAAASKPNGGAAFISIIGGILLSIVLAWVPFLQARFSVDGRFAAFKELRTIREMYRRAPMCWALAAIVTYALSLPLFLATIVLPPQDALWLVTPIFIISIYPARVLTGWAYHQAAKRELRTWFSIRLATGLVLMPVMMIYTLILFFTQFIGSSGKLVLFQHHALLLPRPF
ncbi:MAG: hypothetical protein JWM11_7042 [Planctomycetaceae bacterium]|nr:hypothetical protein [Planctomycetaceae bacterium]